MLTRQILMYVLLLTLPALSECVTSTCKIPSVEAGDGATLTIHFGEDLTNETSRDFTLVHQAYSAKGSQIMLSCHFSNGDVECDKMPCCTWESHVTDVFRVYIHNVSKELEGKFWGFVSPADMIQQKYCNFTLKAFSCPTDSINATNSHMSCSNHPVTLCQTCTVTCNPGYHFKENHNSVTYTCVGKNKWFPENPVRSCEAYTCPTNFINASNSHMKCSTQPVTVGETCIVTCNPDHYFKENQTSLTYKCAGKNKWSPEIPVTSCKGKDQEASYSKLFNSGIGIGISIVIVIVIGSGIVIFICYKKRRQKQEKELLPLQSIGEGEKNWLEFIMRWYPDLQSCTYFLPPLRFNGVQCCQQSVAGYLTPMRQTLQDSGVRDDRALKRVLLCLHALAHSSRQADNSQETDNPQETDNLLQQNNPQVNDKLQQADNSQQAHNPQQEEVMMVISQLQFGKYIDQPSYASAAALLPLYSKLSGLSQRHYDKGDCDVLVIHKTLGLLTLQITSVGENISQLEMTEQEKDDVVKKVKKAVSHLNKAETDLKNLTSNIADIKHITKILVLPNISSSQLLRAIKRFPSGAKFFYKCIGAKSFDDAFKLCLLKDQLSDNQTLSDINHSSIEALREWWQHVRVSRSGPSLSSSLYEQLVARFCGTATTVEVHCVTAPRLNRTLGEVMSETERVARLVLFPQQVDILNQSPPRAFLSGPPGTGKTIVLIMQGLTWIQREYDIHVVSTWTESRAATFLIKHQLQETAKTLTARSHVHRHQFDLMEDGEVETAVRRLKSLSEGRQLCVIADEVVLDDSLSNRKPFTEFCDQLINVVQGVFIWSASVHHDVRPLRLVEVKLTAPLRSLPVVVREVMEAKEMKDKQVHDYTVSDVPVQTYGPPVKRIEHSDGQFGHTGDSPLDCVECGHEVARVLTELDVDRRGDSNNPPPLQYRDVLVLCVNYPTDERVVSNSQMTTSGLVQGLRDRHVPVRVVEKGDEAAIRDTALGVGDLVTVARWNDVRGLERKVVVVASGIDRFLRLHAMSRCTSQLVVINRSPV